MRQGEYKYTYSDSSSVALKSEQADLVVSAIERFSKLIPLNIQEIFTWYFEQKGVDNPEWAIPYVIRNNDKIGRFTAIHMADIVDAKMNDDGTITMKVVDYYDFTKNRVKSDYTKEELKKNQISNLEDFLNKINNRAYHQQKLGKLKPYALYFELTY